MRLRLEFMLYQVLLRAPAGKVRPEQTVHAVRVKPPHGETLQNQASDEHDDASYLLAAGLVVDLHPAVRQLSEDSSRVASAPNDHLDLVSFEVHCLRGRRRIGQSCVVPMSALGADAPETSLILVDLYTDSADPIDVRAVPLVVEPVLVSALLRYDAVVILGL